MAGYKFKGDPSPDAPFLNGVPKRDLSLDEFRALEPSAQSAVAHSDLYERIPDEPAPEAKPAGPPSAQDTAKPAATAAPSTPAAAPAKGEGSGS
jgi:hypothetical protein